MKRSKEDIAEAIDIYKSLGNDTFYGPEEEPMAEPLEQQDQWLPSQHNPDAYYSTVQTSAPRQIDCFTIALGKKTGTTFLSHSTITKTKMLFMIQVLVQV